MVETTKWHVRSNGLNFIIMDQGSNVIAECRQEADAKRIVEMREQHYGSNEYLAAECLVCGWKDQFRRDYCHGDVAQGFCDQCNDEREFRVVNPPVDEPNKLTLDTHDRVFFYEQDFYVLSNFSAFKLWWKDLMFDTSEAAYHWEKFPGRGEIQERIRTAASAHEAFKIAEHFRALRLDDWDLMKVGIMGKILRAKADQHEYVRRKLLATGDRELVENSWRDDFWGWGRNRDGRNMLGRLWMEIRAELRSRQPASVSTT